MPDDDYDAEGDGGSNEESGVMKTLRGKADRTDAAEAKAKALETENAILKAGLGDLSDKQHKAILATHDGELTSEALKATATELGFTTEPKVSEPEPQVPAEEQAAHQRAAAATSGAEVSDAQSITLDDRLKAATSQAEVMSILAEQDMLIAYE